jgi:glycosyltransferase involved in cell wall biosynthesis
MGSSKKIFIVMPAYQAAKTIESVFGRLPAELSGKDVRIVVVNDGSTDGTGEVVKRIAANRSDTELIEHPRNKGYAQAQKTAFAYALAHGADIVVLLHSDGQYAPEMMPELLRPLENEEADVVLGSRMLDGKALLGGMPMYKYIANKGLTTLENIAYGLNMSEYHSGYMLYSRRCLESIPFTRLSDTFHFDGEMILMAAKRKLRIKEISIPTRYADEESHLKPVKYGIDVLRVIWRNFRGGYDF